MVGVAFGTADTAVPSLTGDKIVNWKLFDAARRDVGPIELDLIESYAQGKVSRRNFVKRGTIIGLSAPFMGAIIAACGGSSSEGTATTIGGGDDGGTTTAAPTTAPAPSGGAGGNVIVGIQEGDANSGLDPVQMLDLGTYCVIHQCFEPLVGLGADGNIDSTGLAESWEPNADGSVWTFTLRDGPVWSDGMPVTSADVAATMDRQVEFGNSGLAGVIETGSTDSSDPKKAVITLVEPNGNFPVLVSIFNPQTVITPADYSLGTTLDARPEGTGPFVFESFDATNFVVKFRRNENWWAGVPNFETAELRGFTDVGTAVTAMTAREIDIIQNFSVIGGEGLLADSNFTVLEPPSSNHRQLWFNTQQGDFTDKRLRQAVGWTLNREQMVSVLYAGRAVIGNDHPILSTLPFFDESVTPQRTVDIDMAKQLMSDAGVDTINSVFEGGNIGEVPELAGIVAANAAAAGINLTVNIQDNSTFYGAAWCPGANESDNTLPCDGSASFGAVDYGHRPVPDIFLSSALATGGVWNSSNFANAEFDGLLSDYRTAVDVEGQKRAIGAIQVLMHDEQPALYAAFFNFLAGHDNSVSGVQATALGHIQLGRASKA